ncbi:hypothetical protein IG631_04258 [Alternaria alternata]|nr:hypothetical protein IG631_04258 [Alternaria alternata]
MFASISSIHSLNSRPWQGLRADYNATASSTGGSDTLATTAVAQTFVRNASLGFSGPDVVRQRPVRYNHRFSIHSPCTPNVESQPWKFTF